MWWRVDWCEANSLDRTRREFIEAEDIGEVFREIAKMTFLSDMHGSAYVDRIAGPPSEVTSTKGDR